VRERLSNLWMERRSRLGGEDGSPKLKLTIMDGVSIIGMIPMTTSIFWLIGISHVSVTMSCSIVQVLIWR